jgi:hypothetical protein
MVVNESTTRKRRAEKNETEEPILSKAKRLRVDEEDVDIIEL